jgi:hypothetical protein
MNGRFTDLREAYLPKLRLDSCNCALHRVLLLEYNEVQPDCNSQC